MATKYLITFQNNVFLYSNMVEKTDVNTESPHHISSVLLFGTLWQFNRL